MNTLLLYPIADTLQMVLTCPDSHTIRGKRKLRLQLGQLELESDMLLETDYFTDSKVGVLVKIRKKLWAYITVATGTMRLHLFNAEAVNLRTDEAGFFTTGNEKNTLRRIAPGVVASFVFSQKDSRWVSNEEATCVDEGQQGESIGFAFPDDLP